MAKHHRIVVLIMAWTAVAGPACAVAETTRWFIVGELPGQVVHGDSYVLPLTDPTHIAHAEALIDQGPSAGATIAVANIAPGADGINRDHLATGAPQWSWHVTDFQGFADVTAEVLDGWPGFVESDVQGWITNTGGTVGFWNYTVTAEVPEPSVIWFLVLGGGLLMSRRRNVTRRTGW